MKILITGMTGFVGASITRKLFHSNHEIIGVVRNKLDLPDEILEKYRIIRADISKEVPEIDCDLVIHCAATVSEKILSFYLNKTNVEGTRHIMNAIPKHARMIFISSGSVYNINKNIHKEAENINTALLTPYGRSKYFAEELLRNEYSDRKVTILRPRAVYGKGDRVILPRLLKLYKNNKLRVPGDLDQQVSMTNIDYLTEVIMNLIDREEIGNEIINVADPHVYNLGDNLTALLSGIFNKEVQIQSMNEQFLRIVAGMRTVLVPGNQFTQTSIDYLTRDHVLSTEKLERLFPDMQSVHFKDYLPSYVEWVNNIGLQKIVSQNKRILWM